MSNNASPTAEEASAYYEELLRSVFAGRRFLIAGPVAVGLRGLARRLTRLGAERPFLLAASEGTGSLPTPEEAELRILGIEATDAVQELRGLQRALADLPTALRNDIDAWDPTRTARLILAFATPWAASVNAAGRKVYGARPAAWAALEDKVRVDAFCDAAGVRRAPSRIVPADYETLTSAARALDRGLGTVWAADARDGIHGGALGLRWVRRGDDGAASFASLRRMADRVRVMPFLEGIPASIHGIVFPDSVAVFRPVEMVVLRPTAGDRLFYAGCATAFDPHPDDREAMRDVARWVGTALRETVGYRGPFGIDGVLAEEGYLPTELNARAGAGLGPLAQRLDLPLTPLCLTVTEGERLDCRPDLLERAIVESADAHRTCAGWSVTPRKFHGNRTLAVLRDGSEYRETLPGEESDGTLQAGPGAAGGFLRFALRPERIERGPSAAPEVARAFRFADRTLGTEFGELEVARNVRP